MATIATSRLAVRGDRQVDLHAILDPGCALAIWDRALPPEIAGHVAAFDPESVDDVDATIPADAAAPRAAVLLGAAGYEGAIAVALATEIGAMTDLLSLVMPAAAYRLRLEVVETDACRRFHADSVTMRMICTLRGPGTQWIEADRPDAIEEVPTGAVALFKGRLLMPDPPVVLHRSPPIAGTGLRRLVLVVDPVTDADLPIPVPPEPAP